MNSLPVIVRELRAEARNPATYFMRFGAAAALVGILAFVILTTPKLPADAGGDIFRFLHIGLHLAIWILVPLMTADCISRERRENTLGLLFLTPLGALDIVVAKSFVHALRAVLLWLAALPVLTVPLLLGGVSGTMIVCSVLVNATALCWALAAGLLASAFSKQRMQALALAGALAFGCFVAANRVSWWSVTTSIGVNYSDHWGAFLSRGAELNFNLESYALNSHFGGGWSGRGTRTLSTASLNSALLVTCARPAAFAVVSLLAAMLVAGRAIRLNWQEKPPSRRYLWFLRVFCEPLVWRAFFQRWIRGKLEKNPIGWLEHRSWVGRTAVGAWVAVVASFYIAMLGDSTVYRRVLTEMQFVAGLGLALAMTVVAAGSFRRERELGVMELLLITPQTEAEIALGRLKGIWEQFAPAIALLLGAWLWLAFSLGDKSDWQLVLFFAVTFVHLPVTGLYQSLKQRGLLSALLWTLWLGLFAPLAMAFYLRSLAGQTGGWTTPYGLAFVVERFGFADPGSFVRAFVWLLPMAWQLGFAWRSWKRLRRTLTERSFPMEVQ
jgi:ABC-type transport system involved in multi-copper enzyme maturation permease subunit